MKLYTTLFFALFFLNSFSQNNHLDSLNQILAKNPNDTYTLLDRGLLYDNKKEFDLAIQDYNKVIELDPTYTEAYYWRGYLNYYEFDNVEQALSDFSKAIELNPEDERAFRERAFVNEDLENYDAALKDYDKAIELDPTNSNVVYWRGHLYFYDLDNNEQALSDFSKAIELNPEDARAYNKIGEIYRKRFNYDLALFNYNKAIELEPKNYGYIFDRGLFYQDNNDETKALRDYNKIINNKIEDLLSITHYNKSIIFEGQNKINQAKWNLKKACEYGLNNACKELENYK